MSEKNKKRRIALLVASPLLLVMLSYVAGLIFVGIVWKGKMPVKVTPLTIFDYLYNYGNAPELKKAFAIAIGAPSILVILLLLVVLFKPRRATLHGEGRWANTQELQKAKMLGGTGVVLGELNRKIVTAHPEHHIQVAAPTGAGKGVAIVIPNLMTWDGSAVINDVKGENFGMTSRFRQLCGHKIFVFNPSDAERRTHRWNPFDYVSRDPMLRGKGIQRIAAMLWPPADDKGEPFKPGARSLFTTLALWHLETEGMVLTLANVAMMGTMFDEKETKKKIKEREEAGNPYSRELLVGVSEFFKMPDKFRESVRGEFSLGFEVITKDPLLRLATSESDFDIRQFRKERMSLYVVTPGPDLGRLRPLLNLLFQQIGAENTEVEFGQDPEHKHQLMFLLDEFTSLGDLASVVDPIAYYRSYGIKLVTIYQSESQVEGVYGEHRSATFRENHKTRVVFTPVTMAEAKRVSEELPTTTSYSIGKSGHFGERKSISHNEQARALMLPDEVKLMPDQDAIVFSPGIYPAQLKKIRYFENPDLLARFKHASPMLAAVGKRAPTFDEFKAARAAGELRIEVPPLAIPEAEAAPTITWGKDEQPVFRAPGAEDMERLSALDLADFRIPGLDLTPPPSTSTAEERKAYADDLLRKMFDS